jgi:hypothetical protein
MLIGGRGRPRESPLHEKETRMSAENEALVRRHVEEVYEQCKLEVVDEFFDSMSPQMNSSNATRALSARASKVASMRARISSGVKL